MKTTTKSVTRTRTRTPARHENAMKRIVEKSTRNPKRDVEQVKGKSGE